MVSYKDSPKDAMLALREWLIENVPQSKNIDIRLIRKKDRAKIINQRAKEFGLRGRINVKWREDLSDRLRITTDDILKATNTVVEIMEEELALGGTVRISGLGDFKNIAGKHAGNRIRRVRFYADEQWTRLINEPLYSSEIGLKRKLVKKKLIRRTGNDTESVKV